MINRGEKFHLGCKRDVLLDQLDKDGFLGLPWHHGLLLVDRDTLSQPQTKANSIPACQHGGSTSELLDGAETNKIESEEGMLSSLPPGEDKILIICRTTGP